MRLHCPVSTWGRSVGLAAWWLVWAPLLQAKIPYRELVAPDTVQRDLKGAVREVHEKSYQIGEHDKRVLQTEKIVRFDREGYQVLEQTKIGAGPGWNSESRTYVETLAELRRGKGSDMTMETDLAKKLVTWRSRNPAGKLKLTKEVTYDAFRKVAAGRDYDAKGHLTQSYRVTRDARGLGTEILFLDASGQVKYRSVPTWDERGIMLGSVDEFVADHSTAERKFEPVTVDAAGNWTELRKSGRFLDKSGEHPAPIEVITRVIEYYPPGS